MPTFLKHQYLWQAMNFKIVLQCFWYVWIFPKKFQIDLVSRVWTMDMFMEMKYFIILMDAGKLVGTNDLEAE